MRIVFLGSGAFGVPTLEALCASHDVRLVITQPDRPAGRRRHLTSTPIGQFAEQHNLPVIKPDNVNDENVVAQIREAEPEANIVVAFGQKIGPAVIDSPSRGAQATMNLHASLLPRYRGAAPINWAIMQGEKYTGNTVFSLVEKMDAGDLLGRQRTDIHPNETAGELHDRLAAMGPQLVCDVLDQLAACALDPEPQDESQVTMAPKLSKADAVVDFHAMAEFVRAHVHGLTPWPGVRVWWAREGEAERHPLFLRRVEAIPSGRIAVEPGTIVAEGVIAAGEGAVRLLEVQPPGKRQMSWSDFQRGHNLPLGTRFYPKQAD